MQNDEILLGRIEEQDKQIEALKEQIKEMRSSKAWLTKNVGHPIRNLWRISRGKVIGISIISSVVLGIAWLAGGTPTGNFYVSRTGCNNYAAIYQEYDWGLDPMVLNCGTAMLDTCIARMQNYKATWEANRSVIR